jgi:hypothetical protein
MSVLLSALMGEVHGVAGMECPYVPVDQKWDDPYVDIVWAGDNAFFSQDFIQ